MLGWIIFGGIVLLIVLLLWQSVKATLCYENGKVELKARFLFFTLFPLKPKKPKKTKPKKQKAGNKAPKESAEEHTAEESGTEKENLSAPPLRESENKRENPNKKAASKPKKQGKSLQFDLELIMDMVRGASPPIKRLFKKIRVRNLYIDYVVGTDDAAKTAIKYGTICASLYPLIEWLTTYFSVQAKEINIQADFSREKDDAFAYCEIKLRVGTALGCVLWFGVRVLKAYMKHRKNSRKKMPLKA